jgi:plasmid stability protein
MATLNIKNLPDDLYEELKVRADREHRSIAQQVTHMLEAALREPAPLSILELQGLGKEVWRSVDATAHVEAERRAWD